MNSVPQEIRISYVKIPFVDESLECCGPKAVVSIMGAVVTSDGTVHSFNFERGRMVLTDKKDSTKTDMFSKNTIRKMETVLEAYSHGIMKLNVIQCQFDDVPSEVCKQAEIEE